MSRRKYLILTAVFLFLVGASALIYLTTRRSDGPPIRIAAILPLTGPNAAIGTGMMNSVELAINEFNLSAAPDRQIELLKLDDESNPEVAVALATRVCADPQVLAAIAHYNSPCAVATIDIFEEHGVPTLIAGALASEITARGHRQIMRIPPDATSQAVFIARYIVEVGGYERAYLLDDSTAWGRPICDSLADELESVGTVQVSRDSYRVEERDFTALLTRIKAASPDVVVVCGVSTEGGLIRKQMSRLGMENSFFGVSGICTQSFLTTAGTAADGARAIFVLPPVEVLPGGQSFLDGYESAGYEDPPEVVGILGYAAAETMLAAMEDVRPLSRQTISASLRGGAFETAVGPVKFGPEGQNQYYLYAFYEATDGRWTATHIVDPDGAIRPSN